MPHRPTAVVLVAGCLAGAAVALATAAAAAPVPTRTPTAPAPSSPAAPTPVATGSGSRVPPPPPSRTVAPGAPIAVPAGGGRTDNDVSALAITLLASGVALAGGGTVLLVRRK